MRRDLVVAGTVVLVAVLAVLFLSTLGSLAPSQAPLAEHDGPPEEQVVRFADHESGIWPWLSPEREFDRRSPINVVVLGDTERVIRILQASGEADWQETPPDQREARESDYAVRNVSINGTGIAWRTTGGGARYAYVEREPGDGEWVSETAHLHDGDYYGHRVHLRLYESPREDEEWVAVQAHTEHFDWFTLRHAVDGVQDAQVHVERDLFRHPQVDRGDVVRRQLGNGDVSDSDGWATVVYLVLLGPLALLGPVALVDSSTLRRVWDSHLTPVDRERVRALRRRLSVQQGLLAAAILGIVLGVRAGGVLLERHAEVLSMHAIATLLYPVIALGLPLATYLVARHMERRMDAAVTAALSMTAAILADYVVVGVGVIPIDILLHRLGVIVAVGLLAGGAAQRAARETRLNELAVSGILLWVLLLLLTLFEFV